MSEDVRERPIVPVANASGDVTISGVVRVAGDVLTSPTTQRSCVCFEVHGSMLDSNKRNQGACDFLVEDASGRALVVMDHYELALGSLERGQELMSVLEADIGKVSGQISDLKAEARNHIHAKRRKIDAQLRDLKGLATLLCAIRAHARGNVHVGKTPAGQERYIQKHSAKFDELGTQREVTARYLTSYDTVLSEGDTVTIVGHATQEPDPDGAAGYRDRAMRTVLRAPSGGVLLVSGEGAEEAASALAPIAEEGPLQLMEAPVADSSRLPFYVFGAVLLVMCIVGMSGSC